MSFNACPLRLVLPMSPKAMGKRTYPGINYTTILFLLIYSNNCITNCKIHTLYLSLFIVRPASNAILRISNEISTS